MAGLGAEARGPVELIELGPPNEQETHNLLLETHSDGKETHMMAVPGRPGVCGGWWC